MVQKQIQIINTQIPSNNTQQIGNPSKTIASNLSSNNYAIDITNVQNEKAINLGQELSYNIKNLEFSQINFDKIQLKLILVTDKSFDQNNYLFRVQIANM